jgi:hypothetical protein
VEVLLEAVPEVVAAAAVVSVVAVAAEVLQGADSVVGEVAVEVSAAAASAVDAVVRGEAAAAGVAAASAGGVTESLMCWLARWKTWCCWLWSSQDPWNKAKPCRSGRCVSTYYGSGRLAFGVVFRFT